MLLPLFFSFRYLLRCKSDLGNLECKTTIPKSNNMVRCGRFLSVIVFAIAACLCLTLCAIPRPASSKPDGHCHNQNNKDTNLSKHCCSDKAILTSQTRHLPDLDCQSIVPELVSSHVEAFSQTATLESSTSISNPTVSPVLRI